jgi:L-ascorbate metabolism protein UlaG (beta-lactamase superfamily)
MKIKLFGMSATLITSDNGFKIFTDPYAPEPYERRYASINETADVVTVSHEQHNSHNHTDSIKGKPIIYRGLERMIINGIEFSAVASFHDEKHGKSNGNNTIILFKVDGIRICHLGDLGHKLSDKQLAQVGKVDILLIPVMGEPVMSLELTNLVTNQINAKITIPIHYWNRPWIPPVPKGFDWTPIFNIEDYLKNKKNVIRMESFEAEFGANTLPKEKQVVLLKEAADLGAYKFNSIL